MAVWLHCTLFIFIFINHWYVYDRCSGGEVGKSFRQPGQLAARPLHALQGVWRLPRWTSPPLFAWPSIGTAVGGMPLLLLASPQRPEPPEPHEIAVFSNLYRLQPSRVSLQPIHGQTARPSNLSGRSSLSDLCCAKLEACCQPFSKRVCRESSQLDLSAPSISQSTSFQGQFPSSPSVKTTSNAPASSASSYSDRTLHHAPVRACFSCLHALCPTRAWFSHTRAVI